MVLWFYALLSFQERKSTLLPPNLYIQDSLIWVGSGSASSWEPKLLVSPQKHSQLFKSQVSCICMKYLRKSCWLFYTSLPEVFFYLHNSTFAQIIYSIVGNHWWKLASLTVLIHIFILGRQLTDFLLNSLFILLNIALPVTASCILGWLKNLTAVDSLLHKLYPFK